MNWTKLTVTAAVGLALSTACGPQAKNVPMLGDVTAGDRESELVDRSAALAGAEEYNVAPKGDALDMTSAGDGYMMSFDGEDLTDDADGLRTFNNYLAGAAYVLAADLITAAVVAPPAIGIAVAANGEITQSGANVWTAENTIQLEGRDVTATLTVAWVGVGWLSEMRLNTSDGEFQDQLWFNGFLSIEGAVGWWDFYENGTDLVGVLEWISDGTDAQFGFVITGGEYEGDFISYTVLDGVGGIESYDASEDKEAWIYVNPDNSGEVRLPEFNEGAVACWDTTYNDVACP